ncbi:M48 family peptidase [Methylolobus aquaticus]|nr:M48 family peptidase [Methylolobus aquaticus]
MTTEPHRIKVAGITVEVVRKDIKNLHLGVYPPHGRVRVAAPLLVSDDAVRLAVVDKLAWICRQREKFEEQPRQSQREMVNGESHYFLGQRYRLRVREREGAPRVSIRGLDTLELSVRPDSTRDQREATLQHWYRQALKVRVPPLLARWQATLGVQARHWGIKRMKTKWGSCNPDTQRIWLNLELAKKPEGCIEYIVVHELMHLLERHHNDRFIVLMDRHLPSWRRYQHELRQLPLGHEEWGG